MNTTISREEMVKLAGIHFDYNDAYTPVTVGKKNKVVAPRHIWGLSFREINFTNEEELRALTPETVSMRQCYFPNQDGSFSPIDGKLAVVGDESNTPYAIHSNKYEPIQHNVIINAMADAISDTELNMFGHFDNDKGRFNGYGTFANPDCHINVGDKHDDPIMLGMRFFNSHNGDSKFGGEIFGIRAVCSNFLAMGESLGKIKIMHFKSEENLAGELSKILRGFVDKVDAFQDKIHIVKDTDLDINEQESLLWGIGLNPGYIENILTHKRELNPEMGTKGSVWDIYNSSTAFVTYHVGGAHTVKMNLGLSEKIEQMLTHKIDTLIDRGNQARAKYIEQMGKTRQKISVEVVA